MSDFELVSKYWAGPLSTLAMVVISILLLYPLIWRLTIKQLTAAINAIETAKALPATITQLSDASNRLRDVNHELISLKEQLANLDSINDRLQIAVRQINDLQQLTEEQAEKRPIADVPDFAESRDSTITQNDGATERINDTENWDRVSSMWKEVKQWVEAKNDSIPDGRVARKYNSATRYQYSDIADYMQTDGLLTPEQAAALNKMDATFRSIRNRRTPVTKAMLDDFARSFAAAGLSSPQAAVRA